MTPEPGRPVATVHTDRMATGGEAVARLADGRVVFVAGALPGETIELEVVAEKKRFARGVAVAVVEASADRVVPGCPHARSTECGGCDWMYIDHRAQTALKRELVVEQLQRLGGVADPDVVAVPGERGLRTTVRCMVTGGRAGYRSRGSHHGFAASECGAVHPLLESLIVDGRFGTATEVVLRAGVVTGQRMVLTDGPIDEVRVPADVIVASTANPGDAAIFEEIAGRRWRVSAGSFWQASQHGAEVLVQAVTRAIDDTDGAIVDLYAGVGLLGGAAGGDRLAVAVESNPSSAGDAIHNLGPAVRVVEARVERWTPVPAATVIADPARRGLGRDGVSVIAATGATRLALVSCDPASLGRDTALLQERGWRYCRGEVIDMFPDTSQIEVVSSFGR